MTPLKSSKKTKTVAFGSVDLIKNSTSRISDSACSVPWPNFPGSLDLGANGKIIRFMEFVKM